MAGRVNPRLTIAATAVLVGVAYLVGAKIGEQLRFLPVTTSVLWPPNAILTATLLLVPARRWWLYLLAALPAHLIVQFAEARPTSLVLALFVTNCSEALLAAAGVRRFGHGGRFDTLRDVAVFVVYAVVAAPFVSSFADAAVVSIFNNEPYWLVWRTRFFANTLTELMLVPAIVMAVTRGWPWIRDAAPRGRVEGALVVATPLVIGIVVFGSSFDNISALREPGTQFAFLLPVLLWAAVRFGPGGLSMALLTTTLVAIWAGAHGRGPFTAMPPAQSVLAFQIFLSVVGIPLLCLAAVIKERRRAQDALAERLRFEELLSQLSGSFVHLSAPAMEVTFETWLRQLGQFLAVDRLALYRFSPDAEEISDSFAWTRPGAAAAPPPLTTSQGYPWTRAQLFEERPVAVSRLEDLPAAAARDLETMRRRRVRSTLVLPLVASGRVFGSLSFSTFTAERAWPDELVQRLRLVAEVFASALAKKDADEALRASERLKSAILASLTSGVAVLDREGRIVAVNKSWVRFGKEPAAWAAQADVGASYVESCRRAGVAGRAQASDAVELVEAVLQGSVPTFTLEYGGSETVARWFTITVVPLTGPDGGAVVAHAETTEFKRAEIDAQRVRQELAHSARVSTMGELTASLAHELNQPLAGIMTNARAAQRFLDATPPDYRELRSILSDIIADDKRAAEVIERLRELMRKGQPESARVDVNDVVRAVTKLVSSDAIIRGVTIRSDLAAEPLMVLGDRVQLQQLFLNLLLNAMEAMSDGTPAGRTVIVRTRSDGRSVEVFVEDAGPGLAAGAESVIFDPFYTTKSSGMGMGLSIARSIVEAHGGAIWARNNRTRGATFHFALPLAGRIVP